MRDIKQILDDLLLHIGYVEQFASEGYDVFIQDVKTQFAIRLAYEVIGDLVKQLPNELLDQYPQVRWRSLKGLRDVLAHQYFQLDLDEIWRGTSDITNLKATVETIIMNLENE